MGRKGGNEWGKGWGKEGDLGGEVRGRARVYCVSVMGIQGEGGRGNGEVWLIGVVGMGEDVRLWWREEGVGGLGAFRGGGMGDGMGYV